MILYCLNILSLKNGKPILLICIKPVDIKKSNKISIIHIIVAQIP